jgi:serine protease AprX
MARNKAFRRVLAGTAASAVLIVGAVAIAPPRAHLGRYTFIVRARSGREHDVARAARTIGARVERSLPFVDAIVVDATDADAGKLRSLPDVVDVVQDARLHFDSVDPHLGYDSAADYGSLYDITRIIGAQDSWKAGYTGKGVDVALIDTGISPVPGLTSGNIVNGPDLSFDSQIPKRRYVDGFGHGTHMASLIAGRDKVLRPTAYANPAMFAGVAPDARIVNVKVGAADGAADVSQVIAGIDWVVQHRNDHGLRIRVLSLSFGTDSVQNYRLDPLAYAAERAWRAGIVVVVSGGNDGAARPRLSDPAIDPLVLAVGASDPRNTINAADDTVPGFSSRGNAGRHVDVVAPGVHVLGLRDPGSYIDTNYPIARVGTRFFRGSGTSQATAITAGAVALFLQRYPNATPDQVKRALMTRATPLDNVSSLLRGAGSVQVRSAQLSKLEVALQPFTLDGTGTGSLELARGTSHVSDGTAALTGERDIFGAAWNGPRSARLARRGTSWTRGIFNGNQWTGSAWTGTSWTATTWAGMTWAKNAWSGRRWTAVDWAGRRWTSNAWAVGAWR